MNRPCTCSHSASEHNNLGICTVLACGCRDFTTPASSHGDLDLDLAQAVGVAQDGGA